MGTAIFVQLLRTIFVEALEFKFGIPKTTPHDVIGFINVSIRNRLSNVYYVQDHRLLSCFHVIFIWFGKWCDVLQYNLDDSTFRIWRRLKLFDFTHIRWNLGSVYRFVLQLLYRLLIAIGLLVHGFRFA